jgi:hypothetical protein
MDTFHGWMADYIENHFWEQEMRLLQEIRDKEKDDKDDVLYELQDELEAQVGN